MSADVSRSRVSWVDTGRGLAIMLVVLYHSANWFAVPAWQSANSTVSTLRMPLFFAISGMFAGKWLVASWADLWRVKISLFTWVVLIWSGIGVVALSLGLRMQGVPYGVRSAVRNYLMTPFRPQLELWFLWALALFFLAAKLLRRAPSSAVLLGAAAASAVALSGVDLGNTGWNGALRYFFFFLVGLFFRSELLRWGAHERSRSHALVLIAWAAVSLSASIYGLWSVPLVYYANCLLGLLAGISLSRALSSIEWIKVLGRQTLPVYIAHTPIVLVLAFASWSVFADPSPGGWGVVLVPLAAACAVLLSLRLHRAVSGSRVTWLYEPPRWYSQVAARLVPVRRRGGARVSGASD